MKITARGTLGRMITDPRTPSGDADSAVGSTGAVLCTLQYPPVKPFRDHAFVSFPSDTGGIGPTVFFDPASSN